jgi:hypothetical protein
VTIRNTCGAPPAVAAAVAAAHLHHHNHSSPPKRISEKTVKGFISCGLAAAVAVAVAHLHPHHRAAPTKFPPGTTVRIPNSEGAPVAAAAATTLHKTLAASDNELTMAIAALLIHHRDRTHRGEVHPAAAPASPRNHPTMSSLPQPATPRPPKFLSLHTIPLTYPVTRSTHPHRYHHRLSTRLMVWTPTIMQVTHMSPTFTSHEFCFMRS